MKVIHKGDVSQPTEEQAPVRLRKCFSPRTALLHSEPGLA